MGALNWSQILSSAMPVRPDFIDATGPISMATAATCNSAVSGTNLTSYAVLTAANIGGIAGRVACMGVGGNTHISGTAWGNQELLSGTQLGGSVIEKSTGSIIGTYSVDGTNNLLTFSYASGDTYSYTIFASTQGAIQSGNYFFCPQTGGLSYRIVVQSNSNGCGT